MDQSMMYLLVGAVIFVFIISIIPKGKKSSDPNVNLPYEKKTSVLTNYELNFYKKLNPIADKNNYLLLIKPRLADIVSVKKGTEKYYTWFNKISAKHVDFLLCDPDSLKPLIGIELDDKSHEREDRKKRDNFVDDLYKVVELPILHITKQYELQTLEDAIINVCKTEA